MSELLQHVIAVAFGIPFIYVGILHFRSPELFEPIVPEMLGNPTFWVYLSGSVSYTHLTLPTKA